MIICLPQEDELITSHLSRLAHLNGMGFDRFLTYLTAPGRENKKHRSQSLEIYQRASALVGLAPEGYLRRHTMVPIERFAASSDNQVHNFEIPSPHRQRDTLLRLNLPIHFCQQCATDELSSRGFSTWRRTHQIKGIEWCVTHGISLNRIPGSQAKNLQPHMVALDESFSLQGEESWKQVAAVMDYTTFCLSALRDPLRFHRKEISSSLLHHYLEKRLATKPGSPGKRLSDVIKEHYPASWLTRHYPRIAGKANGEHCSNIDRIVSAVAGIPGELYVLTLSCIFKDHQDAIAHIKSPVMKSRHNKLDLTSMIELWLKHRGNFLAIANSVNRLPGNISNNFRSSGLPSSHLASDDQIEEVACFLQTSVKGEIEEWLCGNKSLFLALPPGRPATIDQTAPLPTRK